VGPLVRIGDYAADMMSVAHLFQKLVINILAERSRGIQCLFCNRAANPADIVDISWATVMQ